MEHHPLVSVIIPVFNTGAYLGRCLESVAQNTYRELEIICVNDGSTDDSLEILRRFAARDNRFRLIDKANGGLSSARNTGMEAAQGEYVAFIDSDDWVHPAYISMLLTPCVEQGVDLCICDYLRTDGSEPLPAEPGAPQPRSISRHDWFSLGNRRGYVWGRLYRRSLIDQMRFLESSRIEDSEFNLRLLARSAEFRICYLPAVLYAYFCRPGSLVGRILVDDVMELGCMTQELAMSRSDGQLRDDLLADSMKRFLFARYVYGLTGEGAKRKQCRDRMRAALSALHSQKWKYTALTVFPFIYRIFRILNDPTMLQFEKLRRQERRP